MTVESPSTSPLAASGFQKLTSGRSMLGKQADSRKTSAPTYSFSQQATRDAASKTFLSLGHQSVTKRCTEGPGAVYDLPGSLDRQVEALKSTAPRFSLNTKEERMKLRPSTVPGPGTYHTIGAIGMQPESLKSSSPQHRFSPSRRDNRDKLFLSTGHLDRELRGTMGPDPGHYSTTGCVGPQALSTKRRGPSFSWGTQERMVAKDERARRSLPPVGRYETWHSIGRQTLSTFKTLPAHGFGHCSTRDQESKRFLTLGHTRVLQGGASPANYGHQTQETLTTFGKQVLSNKSHSPSMRFGSSQKMPFKPNTTPGPGSYD